MHLSAILAVVVALQVASISAPERTPDLQQVLRNNAALSSVEVLYRVEGQVITVRGDGTVLKQSTRQQLPLLRSSLIYRENPTYCSTMTGERCKCTRSASRRLEGVPSGIFLRESTAANVRKSQITVHKSRRRSLSWNPNQFHRKRTAPFATHSDLRTKGTLRLDDC